MIRLIQLEGGGGVFQKAFLPPYYVPSLALACLRRVVVCKILVSTQCIMDCLIEVGADEHAGCVKFNFTPICH